MSSPWSRSPPRCGCARPLHVRFLGCNVGRPFCSSAYRKPPVASSSRRPRTTAATTASRMRLLAVRFLLIQPAAVCLEGTTGCSRTGAGRRPGRRRNGPPRRRFGGARSTSASGSRPDPKARSPSHWPNRHRRAPTARGRCCRRPPPPRASPSARWSSRRWHPSDPSGGSAPRGRYRRWYRRRSAQDGAEPERSNRLA